MEKSIKNFYSLTVLNNCLSKYQIFWIKQLPKFKDIFNKFSFLDSDELRIKELLTRHTNYTNSSRSRFILNNFDEEIKYFVKVLPIDFKKAIENKKLENSKEGKDVLWEK